MKKILASFPILLIILVGCGDDSSTNPTTAKETAIDIVNMDPASPAILNYYKTSSNDRINITFNYAIAESETDGVKIWIEAANSPGENDVFYYSPSPVYTDTGSKTVMVSCESDKDTIHISQLEVTIINPDTTIANYFINDVDYTFIK